jgi:hypothetical protein
MESGRVVFLDGDGLKTISPGGTIELLAGKGDKVPGVRPIPADEANFKFPADLSVSGDSIYIADSHRNTVYHLSLKTWMIRAISNDDGRPFGMPQVMTITVTPTNELIYGLRGIALKSGTCVGRVLSLEIGELDLDRSPGTRRREEDAKRAERKAEVKASFLPPERNAPPATRRSRKKKQPDGMKKAAQEGTGNAEMRTESAAVRTAHLSSAGDEPKLELDSPPRERHLAPPVVAEVSKPEPTPPLPSAMTKRSPKEATPPEQTRESSPSTTLISALRQAKDKFLATAKNLSIARQLLADWAHNRAHLADWADAWNDHISRRHGCEQEALRWDGITGRPKSYFNSPEEISSGEQADRIHALVTTAIDGLEQPRASTRSSIRFFPELGKKWTLVLTTNFREEIGRTDVRRRLGGAISSCTASKLRVVFSLTKRGLQIKTAYPL